MAYGGLGAGPGSGSGSGRLGTLSTSQQFPTHNAPRVWFLTSGDSPVGISLTRMILSHGDCVVSGIDQVQFERDGPRGLDLKRFLAEVGDAASAAAAVGGNGGGGVGGGWKERLKFVALDIRNVSSCQAAIATAVQTFQQIDILLCCTNEAMVGSVEEFGQNTWSRSLVRDQFEVNFFGPMNVIKSTIPEMRRKTNGHIIVLSSISGHLGTPGLGMYCASGWALEGFCDSIAYEIAPFNIKLTIVQSSIEIGILTNKITCAPAMDEYSPDFGNTAPMFRNLLDGLLNRLPSIRSEYLSSVGEDITSPSSESERQSGPYLLSSDQVVGIYPPLDPIHVERLVAETVHAITAIGGHENPPTRHIVGLEGVASVKEKLKTVSEELEEFVDASVSVDMKPDVAPGQGSTSRTLDKRLQPGGQKPHQDVYDAAMVLQAL